MELYPLFSTPVVKCKLNHTLDLNYLESLDYILYGNSGYRSLSDNILLEEYFSDLKYQIETTLNRFLFEYLNFTQGQIVHTGSWINLHTPGDHAPKHNHTNSFYSGVFYLDVPKDSGKIWFVKPTAYSTYATPTIDPMITEFNIHNSNEWGFDPESNDLLLFPSHLDHSVDVNESNSNRYSLAFNYFLHGIIGGDTGNLNLQVN